MKITTTPSNRIGYIKESRTQFDRASAFDEFDVYDDHFYKKFFAKRAKWACDPFEDLTGKKDQSPRAATQKTRKTKNESEDISLDIDFT